KAADGPGVLPRLNASRYKNIEFAVTIEVKRFNTQLARVIVRQRVGSKRKASRSIVDIQPILVIWTVRLVLVSSTRHVNVLVAVIVSIKDEYSSILMGGGRTRHVRQAPFREPGVVALEKHLCRTARVSSNTNII